MDARGFIDLLRSRWTVVAVGLMVGLIGGVAVALLTPVRFEATAQVMLRTPGWNAITSGDVADSSPYEADQFAQKRARTYANLVTANGFADRLVMNSRLSRNAGDLSNDLSGRVVPDTVLIEVTAKDPTSNGARQLADAAAAELIDEIRQLETPSGSRIATIEPVLTSPAVAPREASDPNLPFILTIGGSGGFLAGVTASALMGGRRRTSTADATFHRSSK